jgi:hypothetical protein
VTNLPAQADPPRYEEEVDPPLWLVATLLASLVATVFAVAAPAFESAGWKLYAWYFPLMLFAAALLVISLLSFRRLRICVDDRAVRFNFGLLRKSLPLENIQASEAKGYRWLTYGGWGIRYARGGRRAWSMPGVPGGVEFTVAEGTKVRRYFVSSRYPELLAAAARER